MVDWPEAGRKADAHRIRDLYRAGFRGEGKAIARRRVIAALKAAGGTTVLDLWGGGVSARQFVEAGFRVIAVDDGSMKVVDKGHVVRYARKRRALERTAAEDGYEARWGKVAQFASEADVAFLDFCGPWTMEVRAAIQACRHMKAVVVTLIPDHDIRTDALDPWERQMGYQLYLRMTWAEKPRWEAMASGSGVRRLTDYRRHKGPDVWVFLLGRRHIQIPRQSQWEREQQRPDMKERHNAVKRAWYHRLTSEQKQVKQARWKARYRTTLADPVKRAHFEEVARRAAVRSLHRRHLRGAIANKPCPLCVAERPAE